MRIEYDNQVGALYIRLREDYVHHTVDVKDGLNLDFDKEGRLIGIEILDARTHYTPQELFIITIEPLVLTEDVLVVDAKALGK